MASDFELKQGSALDVLKGMPDESVQVCVTSPPYYGLRSYGTEPQIWGNHNGCTHEWGEALKYAKQDTRTPEQKAAQGASVGNSVNSIGFAVGNSGNFCLKCDAWRGELGLEPTFQLYIAHLIEIFAEVKRVLKKDGCCFVNLGDSYVGYKGDNYLANKETSLLQSDSHVPAAHNIGTPHTTTIRNKSLMQIPARFYIAMTQPEFQCKGCEAIYHESAWGRFPNGRMICPNCIKSKGHTVYAPGFIKRNKIIWFKRACMPSSAKDRFTVDFEEIGFFTKEPRYKFNQQLEPVSDTPGAASWRRIFDPSKQRKEAALKAEGIKGGNDGQRNPDPEGRNKRCVWDVPFEPSGDEHYAAYPTKLIEPMILAGSDEGDTVLDIFNGTGTTGLVALRNRRKYIGIELQQKYIDITRRRLSTVQVKLFT